MDNDEETTALANFKDNAAALDGIISTPMSEDDYLLEWHATWLRDGQVYHAHVYRVHELGKSTTETECIMYLIGNSRFIRGEKLTGSDIAAWLGLDAVPLVKWQRGDKEKAAKGKGPSLVIPQGVPVIRSRQD